MSRYFATISFLLIVTLSLITGCAPSRRVTRRMAIPPGLDSSTVVRSSRVADRNFVSSRREKKAQGLMRVGKEKLQKVDEFWAYLEKQGRDNVTLSSTQKANFDRALANGAKLLQKMQSATQNRNDAKYSREALGYCLAAQKYLEEAVRINPFDKNAKTLLATTYYNLEHIFGQQKNYAKSIKILERLVRLEKGEHALYRLLADSYMAVKRYDLALANYRRAEEVMIKTSFLAPPDTSMLFNYVYGQGDVLARMYKPRAALAAFDKAGNLARTKQEIEDVKNYKKWINWDGGNIRASEQWDKILELEAQKAYPQTASACQKILPTLRTGKAKMAVSHKLAVIEFEHLKRQEAGVERMQQVFDAIPEPNRVNPKDETTKTYLNAYGAMLYRMGVEARKAEKKKVSLAYFTKAASFRWDNVAKAYLELVPLVWNTPEQAIQYGKLALAANQGLSDKENCELLSLMIKANKSAGRFDEARTYFENWKNCQE